MAIDLMEFVSCLMYTLVKFLLLNVKVFLAPKGDR